MSRRCVVCYIDNQQDITFNQSYDFCPKEEIMQNREEMVRAAITIISAWFNSEDRRNGVRAKGKMASFETWDDMVRQPVAWIGQNFLPNEYGDVMDAIVANKEDADGEDVFSGMLASLYYVFGDNAFPSSALRGLFREDTTSRLGISKAQADNAQSLGHILKNRLERRVGGLRITKIMQGNKRKIGNLWKVVAAHNFTSPTDLTEYFDATAAHIAIDKLKANWCGESDFQKAKTSNNLNNTSQFPKI